MQGKRGDENESNAKKCNTGDLGAVPSIVGEGRRDWRGKGIQRRGKSGQGRKRLPEAGKTNKGMLWKPGTRQQQKHMKIKQRYEKAMACRKQQRRIKKGRKTKAIATIARETTTVVGKTRACLGK